MTHIHSAVRDKLGGCTGVTALVPDTRIYAGGLPSTLTLPAINVFPISDIPDDVVPDLYMARVQVDIWSNPADNAGQRSPVEIIGIQAAVIACLHRAKANKAIDRWTVGTEVYAVHNRVVENGVYTEDPVTHWLHCPIDVLLDFRKVT